jgi:hypothetical protein
LISANVVTTKMSLFLTSPSWLQLPKHISVQIDCDDRQLQMCDRRSLPWLKTHSISVEVAMSKYNVVVKRNTN